MDSLKRLGSSISSMSNETQPLLDEAPRDVAVGIGKVMKVVRGVGTAVCIVMMVVSCKFLSSVYYIICMPTTARRYSLRPNKQANKQTANKFTSLGCI